MRYYIYFGQYEGISSISLSIRGLTRSDKSHTSIFWPDLQTVVEAAGGSVRALNWDQGHTPTTKIFIYRIRCGRRQQEKFYQFVKDQIGKDYDHGGVASFIFAFLDEDPDKWFCSELFIAACQYAGIKVLDIEPYECSPRDVQLIPRKEYVEARRVPGELPVHEEPGSPLGDT